MKKRNDSGFSFIELVAVIAIMAVAVGLVSYSTTLIFSTRAKGTADKLKSAIENTCQQAMACGGGELQLYVDSDRCICVKQSINNKVAGSAQAVVEEKIGSSRITITYNYTDGNGTVTSTKTLTAGQPLTLAFNPGTGSFKGEIPRTIVISGGGKTYTLTCYSLTGKVTLE